MPWRAMLVPQLPYLRRYARAVTGSQRLGDAAVREVLEAFLQSPEEFDINRPPREELFRVFHRLWRPEGIAAIETPTPAPTATLDPVQRQALMLTAVEGFSEAEAARILAIDEQALTAAVSRARRTIATELQSRVMIIEDEAIIALHLESILLEAGHSVCGIAKTHSEAIELAARTSPELVLADIQLADGSSGIEAVREILTAIDVPVIFVTAFPEKLLTGQGHEPAYLISKPFEDTSLLATIGQALMFHRESKRLLDAEAA